MVNDVKPGGTFLINCQWTPEELEHHLTAEAKRYIAENDIQLYTINAIDLAIEIGMGKRTNTILQSAFFTLANIMPQEDAIQLHEGRGHEMLPQEGPGDRRHATTAPSTPAPRPSCKVDVPAAWADATDDAADAPAAGPPGAREDGDARSWSPSALMDGDRLPVSAFVDHADGQFAAGRLGLREARCGRERARLGRREVHPVQQLRLRVPARHDPPVRTDALRRPPRHPQAMQARRRAQRRQGNAGYQYTLAISPAGLHGLRRCA